jgi:hypothetical protein
VCAKSEAHHQKFSYKCLSKRGHNYAISEKRLYHGWGEGIESVRRNPLTQTSAKQVGRDEVFSLHAKNRKDKD